MFEGFLYEHLNKKYTCLSIAVFFFLKSTAHQLMFGIYREYKGENGNKVYFFSN